MTLRNIKAFVERANRKHNNKYDYSIAITAKNCKEKTVFICPIHGKFEMTWDNHLNGGEGCPKCSNRCIRSNDEWIDKANTVHNNKYDYSKTVFTTAREKVTVICHEKDEFGNEHGEFQIRACNHLMGIGCPKCGHHYNYTNEEWITKANIKHHNKYDYSKCHYVDAKTEVTIICHEKDEFGNEHGEFIQRPYSHLSGCGCPKCNGGVKLTASDFIKKASLIHDNFYDYSKFHYINAKRKGVITCPLHGDFLQTPDAHINGEGCPKCTASSMEKHLIESFRKANIFYIFQYGINVNGSEKRCDFYVPSCNLIIECQGEQHFIPVHFGGNDNIVAKCEYVMNSDKNKYDYLKDKGFDIVYFIDKRTFHDKSIDIHTDFYKDKNIIRNYNDILRYIKLNSTESTDIFNSFCKDISRNITRNIIIKNDYITFKDNVVKFVRLVPNRKDELNQFRRYCIRKDKRVIFVYEDEYVNAKPIVLEKIRHIFGLSSNKNKVYGRNTVIAEITKDDARSFLNENHIQGFAPSMVYLGAFLKDKLIGVMTFTKESKNCEVWELNRFATDNSVICQGVGGKLFAYFKLHFEYKRIKSFADKRWTIAGRNIYETLGFSLVRNMYPDYYYISPTETKRIHKFNLRKDNILKNNDFDKILTETEMTERLGYYKIWNCGLYKYEYGKDDIN